jgi:CDP-diacylglycerol--glycerol-3-phosphate 3-phosphatidyltransferase/cardiolipin synthase
MRWKAVVFAIPNGLSLARIGLGFCFPWLAPSWRLPVIIVAALTDLADGAFGRLFRATSITGRVLDPLADKLFVIAVVATFLVDGLVTPGEVVLVGLRDLVVIGGTITGLMFTRWDALRCMSPTPLGKATTVAQFAFFLVVLAAPEGKSFAFAITVGLSAMAAGHYGWRFLARHSRKACAE